jgi:hypothetical protein
LVAKFKITGGSLHIPIDELLSKAIILKSIRARIAMYPVTRAPKAAQLKKKEMERKGVDPKA